MIPEQPVRNSRKLETSFRRGRLDGASRFRNWARCPSDRKVRNREARPNDPRRNGRFRRLRCLGVAPVISLVCFMLAGCASGTAQSRSALPPESASPDYWVNRPAVATIVHYDFDALWEACRRAVRSRSFAVDRVDLRGGVMTTYPQVSKQLFEFWRNDVGSLPAAMESTLGTVRRYVRVEVSRHADGTYEATPKVVVERYAQSERRVTSVARYSEVFALDPAEQGTRERDRLGADLPPAYWYALGRDELLERQIADDVRRDLKS